MAQPPPAALVPPPVSRGFFISIVSVQQLLVNICQGRKALKNQADSRPAAAGTALGRAAPRAAWAAWRISKGRKVAVRRKKGQPGEKAFRQAVGVGSKLLSDMEKDPRQGFLLRLFLKTT